MSDTTATASTPPFTPLYEDPGIFGVDDSGAAPNPPQNVAPQDQNPAPEYQNEGRDAQGRFVSNPEQVPPAPDPLLVLEKLSTTWGANPPQQQQQQQFQPPPQRQAAQYGLQQEQQFQPPQFQPPQFQPPPQVFDPRLLPRIDPDTDPAAAALQQGFGSAFELLQAQQQQIQSQMAQLIAHQQQQIQAQQEAEHQAATRAWAQQEAAQLARGFREAWLAAGLPTDAQTKQHAFSLFRGAALQGERNPAAWLAGYVRAARALSGNAPPQTQQHAPKTVQGRMSSSGTVSMSEGAMRAEAKRLGQIAAKDPSRFAWAVAQLGRN